MANPRSHNLTTEQIRIDIRSASTSAKSISEEVKEQIRIESTLLAQHRTCPDSVATSAVTERLVGLQPEQLKETVTSQFYNAEVMEAASCLASSLYVHRGEFALSASERIREYLTNLKQIGGHSANGMAISADLQVRSSRAADLFVIKVPRNSENTTELIHECVVGFYGTNLLRRQIPNYAYVYGMFKCAPPTVGADRKVESWCAIDGKNTPTTYAIYENLNPSISFGQFALSTTPEAFLNAYLQVMLALRLGAVECGFTHYDAHHENILMREVSSTPFSIAYQTSNGTEYVTCEGSVPTFIDYGMSHISLRDRQDQSKVLHFGSLQDYRPYGVCRDQGVPIHDAYKLLCFSLYYVDYHSKERPTAIGGQWSYQRHRKLVDKIGPLLTFFNTSESWDQIVDRQYPTRFSLPWSKKIADFRLDDWIDYCRQYAIQQGWGDPIHPRPRHPVLRCEGQCFTFDSEMIKVGVDLTAPAPSPLSFLEFYDAYGALASQKVAAEATGDRETVSRLNQHGHDLATRFAASFADAYLAESRKLKELHRALLPTYQLLPRPHQNLLDASSLRAAQVSLQRAVRFLDAYRRYALSVRAMRYLNKIFTKSGQGPLEKQLSTYQGVLDNAALSKQLLRQRIEDDAAYLRLDLYFRSAADQPGDSEASVLIEFLAQVRDLPEYQLYRWYWTAYREVASLFRN